MAKTSTKPQKSTLKPQKVLTGKWQKNRSQIEFWTMCAIPIVFIIVFCYVPLYGILIAFKDYKLGRGIFKSDWVGFRNFTKLFASDSVWGIIRNTVVRNVINIITGEAAAIALAILLYNLKSRTSTKVLQTMLITPNFLSWVVAAYMCYAILNVNYGLLNQLLAVFGMQPKNWYLEAGAWRFILPIANIWKGFGMGSIMYYAALMAISPEIFEALDIDGGKKWHKIRYIMLPELVPIICIKLIFAVGGIFGGDFGLFYQLSIDSPELRSVTDTMPTYTYRLLITGELKDSTAIGLLQSFVGFLLVLATNFTVKAIDPERSLF